MNRLRSQKGILFISLLYVLMTVILVVAEMLASRVMLQVFKPMLIPILGLLYWFSSRKRRPLYLLGLLFSVTSNVLLLSRSSEFLLYGVIGYFLFRVVTIIIVLQSIDKIRLLPVAVGSVPFLFFFFYLIELTHPALGGSFYPAIGNGLLMSGLAGISLSKYVLDDDRKNSWLLISSLLFVVLVFIFIVQKYYLYNAVFQPLSVIIFAAAHYSFYKFVLLDEEQKIEP